MQAIMRPAKQANVRNVCGAAPGERLDVIELEKRAGIATTPGR
jgi:hypothetical protein